MFSREEVEGVVELLNGGDDNLIPQYIKDPELKKKVEISLKNDVMAPDDIVKEIYKDWIPRISLKDVGLLKQVKYMDEHLLKSIITTEYEEGQKLSEGDSLEFISKFGEIDTIKSFMDDSEFDWSDETKQKLEEILVQKQEEKAQKSQDYWEPDDSWKWEPEDPWNVDSSSQTQTESESSKSDFQNATHSYGVEEVFTKGPLEITEDEKFAIKVYEGVCPHGRPSALSNSGSSYETMNAMLFPGLLNEAVRVLEDHKWINPDIIRDAGELLRISEDLYRAMYKYGQALDGMERVLRVDRLASVPVMERDGETPSNLSTTTSSHYQSQFSKNKIALEEIFIEPGTPCIDFKRVLGSDYTFSGEREILVAPRNNVVVQDVPMTDEEQQIKDGRGMPPSRKVQLYVTAKDNKPLTPEEQKDKEEQEKIFSDPQKIEAAARVVSTIGNYTSVQNLIENMPAAHLNAYLEWKSAFQQVFRYRTREIALEVDKSIEEYIAEGHTIDKIPASTNAQKYMTPFIEEMRSIQKGKEDTTQDVVQENKDGTYSPKAIAGLGVAMEDVKDATTSTKNLSVELSLGKAPSQKDGVDAR